MPETDDDRERGADRPGAKRGERETGPERPGAKRGERETGPERPGATRGERELGDSLPEELDVTAYVGPYLFPDTNRRRIAAAIYAVLALVCLVGWLASSNGGLLAAAIALALIAAYHLRAGWTLKVDQTEALLVATREVGFPVGHASAQLAWRGLLSRPSWRILLYSADEPPSMRGLVELDALDGHVLGEYTEPNPEDWSQWDKGLLAGQPEDS